MPEILEVSVSPEPVRRGGYVKGSCKIKSEFEIESVYAVDPQGGYHRLYDDGTHGDEVAGDGIYTLQEYIGYDVPAGTYSITIIVKDKAGSSASKTIYIQLV